jgi:hypothetical protein
LGMGRRERNRIQLLRGELCGRRHREIDVEFLKSEIKKTYSSVSEEPERDFVFPTGRAWAEDLGYPPELADVPDSAVESFAGVRIRSRSAR